MKGIVLFLLLVLFNTTITQSQVQGYWKITKAGSKISKSGYKIIRINSDSTYYFHNVFLYYEKVEYENYQIDLKNKTIMLPGSFEGILDSVNDKHFLLSVANEKYHFDKLSQADVIEFKSFEKDTRLLIDLAVDTNQGLSLTDLIVQNENLNLRTMKFFLSNSTILKGLPSEDKSQNKFSIPDKTFYSIFLDLTINQFSNSLNSVPLSQEQENEQKSWLYRNHSNRFKYDFAAILVIDKDVSIRDFSSFLRQIKSIPQTKKIYLQLNQNDLKFNPKYVQIDTNHFIVVNPNKVNTFGEWISRGLQTVNRKQDNIQIMDDNIEIEEIRISDDDE